MKTARIEILAKTNDKESLIQKAEAQGMNLSEYLLFCGLNAHIQVNVGQTLSSEIVEIPLLHKMMKDGMITEAEYNTLKNRRINGND